MGMAWGPVIKGISLLKKYFPIRFVNGYSGGSTLISELELQIFSQEKAGQLQEIMIKPI